MQNSFSILFYLKKPKVYSSGPVPIYLRITVNGKRSEISISREINPDKWNSEAGRVIGNNENTKALNVYLDTLKNKVYDAQRKLMVRTVVNPLSTRERCFQHDKINLVSSMHDAS